jgi:heavy metal sensor kinase
MSVVRRLPIRLRLTLLFAGGTALILATVGAFVYVRMGAELLAATDASLGAQADALEAGLGGPGPVLGAGGRRLVGSDEQFAQVADASGRVVESTPAVAGAPLLPPKILSSATRRTFVDRRVPHADNVARLLIVPVDLSGGRLTLVVGTSLQDRKDALVQLAALLGIGGPVALGLTSLGGWLLAGAMLRPVERMRQEAAAISVSEPGRRLPVSDREDELSRLGVTLNSMLERLGASFERERRFLDDASHELRTPLAVLKAELDFALLRDRTVEDLRATVGNAADETDRVVRLAEDLLVLSRVHRGRLEIRREDTSLPELLTAACERHLPRARSSDVRLEVDGEVDRASLDPLRVRQVLDNLLDNALRHTPAGGVVRVGTARDEGWVLLTVEDSGPGFPEDLLDRAFEPFSRGSGADRDEATGAGLGLAIVQAVAGAHGGTARVENRPDGGARVTLAFPQG